MQLMPRRAPARLQFLFAALLLVACSSTFVAAAPATARPKPAQMEIFSRSLPITEPLAVEWLGELTHEGVGLRRLRYTSISWHGEPIRIYALLGIPAGDGPHPAILQIHGGGQTCEPANIAWFVRRGYACLAFDWTGARAERPADATTPWPAVIRANYYGAANGDLTETLVYHAVLAALRGIDVLAAQPQVDAGRIGIQGVSWGGYLCWLVNALDPRVRVSVPVYGIGDLAEQWNDMGRSLGAFPADWRNYWSTQLDPAAFASSQHGAVMYVDAANDFFGPLDIAERRLAALAVPHARSYAPNRMHSLDAANAAAGMAWIDARLKHDASFPAEPSLSLQLGSSNNPVGLVQVDAARPIREVRIDYARGFSLPLLHSWLSRPAARLPSGDWQAELPVVDVTQPLAAIAQVTYEPGFTLSSPVLNAIPAQALKGARATESTSSIIFDWGADRSGWYVFGEPDFYHADPQRAELRNELVGNRPALAITPHPEHPEIHIASRLVADPARNKGNRRALEVWVHDFSSLKVRTNYLLRLPEALEYQAESVAGPGWHRLRFPIKEFNRFDEELNALVSPLAADMSSWNEVKQLNLIGSPVPGGRPAIGRVQWHSGQNARRRTW